MFAAFYQAKPCSLALVLVSRQELIHLQQLQYSSLDWTRAIANQTWMQLLDVVLQAATPLSAVFQFFLRDLSGMLGGVTFAFLQA